MSIVRKVSYCFVVLSYPSQNTTFKKTNSGEAVKKEQSFLLQVEI